MITCKYCGATHPDSTPKCWDGVDGCGAFLGVVIEADTAPSIDSFSSSVDFFKHYATIIPMEREALLLDLSNGRKVQMVARNVVDRTREFIQGNGVEGPLGILSGWGDAVIVDRECLNTVVLSDFANMMASFHASDFGLWLINPNVRFIPFSPNGLFQHNPPTLFDIPVIFTFGCPPLGTKGDVILADLRYYAIGEYGDMCDGVPISGGYEFEHGSPFVILGDGEVV